MSTTTSRAWEGGGGVGGVVVRQFPVGRRRYVPVVDAGCGCPRPRRPRLLSLPSFLKLSGGCHPGGGKARSGGEHFSSSSTSTASFSSSCAATHSSTGYSSAYSSEKYDYGVAAAKKMQQQPALHTKAKKEELTTSKKAKQKQKQKKRHDNNKKMAEEEEDGVGVGVAVEKESSDPRADFRQSMVQMVVEMGLCDWDGLRCMLRRLLALNAPRHHAAILTAFAEVCAQIIAAPSAATALSTQLQPSPSPPRTAHKYRR